MSLWIFLPYTIWSSLSIFYFKISFSTYAVWDSYLIVSNQLSASQIKSTLDFNSNFNFSISYSFKLRSFRTPFRVDLKFIISYSASFSLELLSSLDWFWFKSSSECRFQTLLISIMCSFLILAICYLKSVIVCSCLILICCLIASDSSNTVLIS